MHIGITYDLKSNSSVGTGVPDDFQEEFDSPVTIEAIAGVLRELGHEVEKLGDGRPMLEKLLADPPDLVFNFAEGQGIARSREARVPAVLEMLGIPYTGSDPLTLAATLDKDCARRLVASEGLAIPRGAVFTGIDIAHCKLQTASCKLDYPLIVKPAWEGSSKGIRGKCLVDTPGDFVAAVESMWGDYHQPVLAEEYVEGDELTVGVLGNEPPQILGVMRVLPNQPTDRFIYSLEIKRDFERLVRYECPPRFASTSILAIEDAALKAYRVLGCRDVSRVDFRLRDGIPYFLEVNPLPGLNPESSDLVIMARLVGWSYRQLIETILNSAIRRISAFGFQVAD